MKTIMAVTKKVKSKKFPPKAHQPRAGKVKTKAKKLPVKKKAGKVVKKVVRKTVRKIKTKKPVRKTKLAKRKKIFKAPLVKKFSGNPILSPEVNSSWESSAVFNPGVVLYGGRVHMFYRALGADGMSRIGYASSRDGIRFDERLPFPVFTAENINEARRHFLYTSPARSAFSTADAGGPARLVYDPVLYASGGGWGGCEDARAVEIDGRIYLTFNMFNGWHSMRVAFTSIDGQDLLGKNWAWSPFAYLSRPGDRQKNWVLFPEKFNGKFAILHNLDMGNESRVHIAFVDELDMYKTPTQTEAPDIHTLPDHLVAWHNRTRSASAPPIKTKDGWLLFYHATDKDDPHHHYKVGALLLDLKDPTKVLYRSSRPILSPDEWYENDWKPGVVYASGAIVKDGVLFLYYGGGDKRIAVAYAKLVDFLRQLKSGENIVLSKEKVEL